MRRSPFAAGRFGPLSFRGGLHALHHDVFFDDLNYAHRCP